LANFPTHPDELTPGWLGDALGVPVESFESESLGEGAGLLGVIHRVRPRYAAGHQGPASLVAKFATPTAENRAVAETFDMYGREVRFYARLAGQTPARAPRSWCAELDETNSDFVLLLEDLSGCRVGDQLAGASLADAQRAIREMVRLHGTWWGKTEAPELAWIPVHDNPVQVAGMSGGFQAGWPVFEDRLAELIPAGESERYARIGPATGALIRRMCSGALTVAHGDFRLDNLFFDVDGDPESVAMFDWQGITRSCGPQDLGYFLSQSLRSDVRREHGEALVRSYWEQLCEAGVEGYSFDRCMADYRVSVLYLFSFAVVIAGTLDASNERGVAMVRALAGRSAETVQESGALALLDEI
jgi:hypothetical protein